MLDVSGEGDDSYGPPRLQVWVLDRASGYSTSNMASFSLDSRARRPTFRGYKGCQVRLHGRPIAKNFKMIFQQVRFIYRASACVPVISPKQTSVTGVEPFLN